MLNIINSNSVYFNNFDQIINPLGPKIESKMIHKPPGPELMQHFGTRRVRILIDAGYLRKKINEYFGKGTINLQSFVYMVIDGLTKNFLINIVFP